MSSSRINRNQKFLGLQLGLGLLWLLVMPWLPSARGAARPSEVEISAMLLLAAWLPSLPLAIWQAQSQRRWWVLLHSDLAVCAAAERAAHRCPAALPVVVSSWPSR